MKSTVSTLPDEIETIAELRALFRASESRAARLRLLSQTGRDLSEAEGGNVDALLLRCAERVAFFLGRTKAIIDRKPTANSLPVFAPGARPDPVAWIRINGLTNLDAIADPEDREAVQLTLEQMGSAIDRIHREEERALLLARLQERERHLEGMVGQIFGAQEEERRRVSQELHDGVAQTATALARMIEGIGASSEQDLPAKDRQRIADIARGLVCEVRAVIGGLRPTLLDDLGLVAAVQALADALEADGFAVKVELPKAGRIRLSSHAETALFRVAQEAIANIRKHAGGPCAISIRLSADNDGAAQVLRIEDFGNGLQGEKDRTRRTASGRQVGIDIMRERMAAVGGSLHWEPADHGGIIVMARIVD